MLSLNTDKFNKQIDDFIKQTTEQIDLILQDVVIEIGRSVITLSPVKTGRFKANWQMSVNTPINYSLNSYDGEGSETLSKIMSDAKTFTAGEIAYIVNNLTYGYNIEEFGWESGKAPYKVVGQTEVRFTEIVNEVVKRRAIK